MDNTIKLMSRYPIVNGRQIIELKLKTPHQLLDERDPSPFRERDLDDDAARYIVSAFHELTHPHLAKLSLHFSQLGIFEGQVDGLKRAIHSHFEYESELKRRELRQTFHQGIISLVIGTIFLFMCTYISMHVLVRISDSELWKSFAQEGLFIMGWVAMWRPMSIFLYDWWPIREAQLTLKDLSNIEIAVNTPEPEIEKVPAQVGWKKAESRFG